MREKKNSGLRSPKRRRKKRILLSIGIGLIVIIALLLAGGGMYVLRLPVFQLTTITISGNSVTETSDIQKTVRSVLSGTYVWIIPKTNTFVYPENKIESQIVSTYPRITNARVHRVGTQTLDIDIEERTPFALWCQSEDSNCYFLDGTGYIYAPAPSFSGAVYSTFIGGIGTSSPIGTTLMSPDHLSNLISFSKAVSNLGLMSKAIVLDEDNNYEILLESGGRILFNDDISFDKILKNLETIVTNPKLSLNSEKGLQNLEYINLRFGDKVFFKMKEE